MKKIISCILLSLMLTACNNQADKSTAPKAETKKKNPTIADSYTTDTLYQALPQLLEDLFASENMEDMLAQNWINVDDKETLLNGQDGDLNLVVRTFDMHTDKTIIKNVHNYMETGTWKYDAAKKTITFDYKNGSTDIYKIRALAADELRLTNIGINSETVLMFVSDAKRHKDAATDPFHISNCQWRIAPKHMEADEAIKQRVKDYLHFFILYYKDAIARRAGIVSFYGFPSCLKWFSGGIYMQDDKDALENWETCFYNKAQAKKGMDIVSKLLDKKYTWPTGNQNWIKQNLFVLEQMYNNL